MHHGLLRAAGLQSGKATHKYTCVYDFVIKVGL